MGRNCRITVRFHDDEKLQGKISFVIPLNCVLVINLTSRIGPVAYALFCSYEPAAVTENIRTDMSGTVYHVCSCKADNATQQKEQLHCPRGPRRMLVDHTSGERVEGQIAQEPPTSDMRRFHLYHISVYAQNPESHGCLKPGTSTGMPPHRNTGNVCTYLRMYAISSCSGGLVGRT